MNSDVLAFVAWYLAATAAGLIGLPLAFRLFRHLPDHGFSLARPLGLLVTGYAFWLLGSLGLVRNDVPGVALAALLAAALALAWLGADGRRALREWLARRRHLALGIEAVFLLAFALMAVVRAYNPEVYGTEKPMELMFINSVLRSATFPPQDAWLSGHAISYYYFGYVLVATLARVTATSAEVAFNLGLALLFGLTAVASLGVVLNLIALAWRPERGGTIARPGESEAEARLGSAFWPALLGPLFVLVVGNYYGLAQMAYQNGLGAEAKVWAVRYYFGDGDPAMQGASAEQAASQPDATQPGVRAGWVNVWDWLDLKETQEPAPKREAWTWDTGGNWFFAARVLHDRDLTGFEREAIDENPAFSFVLGDMHPHVLALPFVVLATALALEWLLWGGAAEDERRRTWDEQRAAEAEGASPPAGRIAGLFRYAPPAARLVLSAIILGGLAFLNTWDFPIYLFLTAVALALGVGLRAGWDTLRREWLPLAGVVGVLAVLSVLLYLPFYVTFQSQAGGLLPNIIWPTRLQQSVVFFGPVLIGASTYLLWLAYRGRALLDRRVALWVALGLILALVAFTALMGAALLRNPAAGAAVAQFLAPLSVSEGLRLAAQRRLVDSGATLLPAALIGLAAGVAAGVLRGSAQPAPAPAEMWRAPAMPGRPAWRQPGWRAALASDPHESARALRSPAVLMALAMIVTGALLMLGPEYVYLRDNFMLRMNTLFKFYFQTWTLWALAAAFGLWHMAHAARRWVRAVAVSVVTLAAAAGLVYTFPAIYSKARSIPGPPTLNGLALFADYYPDDWAAIQWLRANVPGSPVIAEAVGGAYHIEESRVAMATGLPTVMGWTNHEGQWRGEYFAQVAGRPGDIQALYQVRDWPTTAAILDRYAIEYVILGPQEHSKYNPIYRPKFEQHMQTVYDTGSFTIYRRRPAEGP